MPLRNKKRGESLEAAIEKVIESDFKRIKSSGEFNFDWSLEKAYEIYKIYLLGKENEILGLMCLINRPDEYRIHLNLIEVGDEVIKTFFNSKKKLRYL
jgi:hypothetical protein